MAKTSLKQTILRDKTLTLYLLFKFFYGLYPINVIIALFFLAKNLSYADIGIIFGVFSVSGFLFEIPTGYFGDKFGRKASVIMGLVIMAITSIVWTRSYSTMHFTVLAAVWMLAISFISGSLEAYIYDYLDHKNKVGVYDYVLSKTGSIFYIAAALGSIIGAYLFSININYPYYLLSILFLVSSFIVFLMSDEEKTTESLVDSELNVFSGLKLILKSRPLILITLFASLLFGFYQYYIHSVDKPYILGLELFDVKWLGIFVSIIYIVKALIISQFEKIKNRFGEFQLMTLSWSLFAIGIFGMYKFFGVIGLLSALVFYSSEPFTDAIINSFSQKHIPKKIRATTLSSIKVYQGFFAAILGFASGYVFDLVGIRQGMLVAFVYSLAVYAFLYLYKNVFKVRLDG